MTIEITNESGFSIDETKLLRLMEYALAELHVSPDADIAIMLVDEGAMEALHVQWMDEPGPTDVLSFPMDELRPGTEDMPTPAGLLGDIVLCPQVAETQARDAHHSTLDELVMLTTHGLLHLLGFDHAEPDDERDIGFLVVTFLSTQAALTLGAPLRGGAVLLTVLVFLATPHLDTMIGNWAQRGLEFPDISILTTAGRQTARFTIVVVMIAMLGTLWATPLAAGFGIDLGEVARGASGVALIALVAAFLWNVVGTVTGRALRAELPAVGGDEEVLGAPRSRLGTLVPLLSAVGKSSILALALLSILVSVGVNVWPLITGLSVFGLAIGFGSQTLVKDVVSGLFFLVDDAFRFGEYIETSGAKGTVEKISIRSVSLRHQRGALATIPYGEIGKIQNFSRDWMIEKLTFRVALDTDVEKVRKIFKKIGQDIMADPELAGDLLEPFKSQGISEVEDGTLVIRAKFKAKAGKQSMIRRAALTAVHRAFQENGIKAVPKPLTSGTGAAAPA